MGYGNFTFYEHIININLHVSPDLSLEILFTRH